MSSSATTDTDTSSTTNNNSSSSSPSSSSSSSDNNDPSGFLSPTPQIVKVINTARNDLNEKMGQVVSYSSIRNRYMVKLTGGGTAGGGLGGGTTGTGGGGGAGGGAAVLSFKAANLRKVTTLEKVRYKVESILDEINTFRNDPRVRHQINRTYIQCKNTLPSYLPPERAGILLLLLLFIMIRFIGLSKLIMIVSLLSMPIVVSLPDLQRGIKDPKVLARNFGKNLKEAIIQSTGYNGVTERMALVGFVIVVGLGIKVLLTPAGGAAAAATAAAKAASSSSSMGDMVDDAGLMGSGSDGGDGSSTMMMLDPEDIYKMGFDDATGSKPYGHSLPSPEELSRRFLSSSSSSSSSSSTVPQSPDLDWTYQPPPPPPPLPKSRLSKLGMGTLMSLFYLGKTGQEMARTPDGQYDIQLFMANVQLMDPMRKGLMALSLYRIVSALFF